MIELGLEASGFSVENDLAHGARVYRMPICRNRRAAVAAFRPGWLSPFSESV
jgi:hypothetical protein